MIAIDPGASGGFAWTEQNSLWIRTSKMLETEGDIIYFMRERFCEGHDTVVMEQVGGFIKGNPAPGSTMFNFGEGFGFIKGAAQTLGMKLVMVRPQVWQKALGLGSKKDYGKEWKNHLKARAQRIYPDIHITLGTADALLILHYALNYDPTTSNKKA